jgi:hypothetical protein
MHNKDLINIVKNFITIIIFPSEKPQKYLIFQNLQFIDGYIFLLNH